MTELERCRPWIEAALEYSGGTHNFADVVADIETGFAQFWPAPRGCFVTHILTFPQKKVLLFFLGGGDLQQLALMHDDVLAWGKAQGCQSAMISGRNGWARILGSLSWTPLHQTLTREL